MQFLFFLGDSIMRIKVLAENLARECLSDLTANDLMSQPPISLLAKSSIPEALEFFTLRGFHAAPVIDTAGRPVGVVSVTDLLRHDLDRGTHPCHDGECCSGKSFPEGFGVEDVDTARVEDIMTNTIFALSPNAKLPDIVKKMLDLDVHQLFVVDHDGLLVGVLSTSDIMRVLYNMLS
jgi:CBS domain-containing protein